jgi:MFS superfamily sulfate permease-like transporter
MLKTYAANRFKKNWISLIPDILTVVAVSACMFPSVANAGLTWFFGWDEQGVSILGMVESGSFQVKMPLSWKKFWNGESDVRGCLSSALVIAILGYFETMVGVKHLSTADNDVSKPNRELVALGTVNAVVCMSLLRWLM